MRSLCRVLGAFVLVLSSVGTLCCVAGAVGVWVAWSDLSRRAERIDTRVAVALERASAANQSVLGALEKARADVRRVSKESASLVPGAKKNRRTASLLRKQVQRQVGPHIDELGGRLATSSAAAVAVAALLEGLQELPPGAAGHFDPDKLGRSAEQVLQVSAALRKLQAALGEGDEEVTGREVAAAADRVDGVLQKCQATAEDWQSDLVAARERQARFQTPLAGWLLLGASAGTALCAWAGMSQVSLAAHAWKWLRGSGACSDARAGIGPGSAPVRA